MGADVAMSPALQHIGVDPLSRTQAALASYAKDRNPYRIEAYQPALRERIVDRAGNAAAALGAGRYKQQDARRLASNLMDFIPGLGEIVGVDEVVRDLRSGRYGNAALGTGAALAGVVPGAGDALGKGLKKLARGSFELEYFGQPVRILQNPSPKELSGFLNRTKYQAARRIHDPKTGETYVWDAADPTMHALVAKKLGLTGDHLVMDMVGID